MRPYPDAKRIRAELARRNFRIKKRWGQNFLFNPVHLDFIVSQGQVSKDDLILEIGAGPGCLTGLLLDAGARVIAVEIDPILSEVGREIIYEWLAHDGPTDRIQWLQKDFLENKQKINPSVEKVIWEELDKLPNGKLKVISNLPYSIATSTIINVFERRFPLESLVVTLQEEVAARFLASPGSKEYGQVSVLAAAWANIQRVKKLSKGCFWPMPEVDSCILKFLPKRDSPTLDASTYWVFKKITRGLFAHRRKTWLKSLKLYCKPKATEKVLRQLDTMEIQTAIRAQDLKLKQIVKISHILSSWVESEEI
jgi:16S rRNA (adenine1518-N6/adenine1519-N6)-dimethyltransferase